jgi:hypothetical protein
MATPHPPDVLKPLSAGPCSVAALYPQIVSVVMPGPKKGGGKISAESIKFLAREEGSAAPVAVALHPSCVASKQTRFDSPYLIYHERVKTTRVYLRDATPVGPSLCAVLLSVLRRPPACPCTGTLRVMKACEALTVCP